MHRRRRAVPMERHRRPDTTDCAVAADLPAVLAADISVLTLQWLLQQLIDRRQALVTARARVLAGSGQRSKSGRQDRAWPTVQGRRTKTSDWIEEVEAPETKLQ